MKSALSVESELIKLKSLYEEELDQAKIEIEELALQRNKLTLDNFNLEQKLKDYFLKIDDITKSKEELERELRETKSKLNRVEYDLETAKLEIDKPLRDNKQLRKELDDLVAKMNELQIISDSEISYRQQLEKKLKEISDKSIFREKLSQQEMENYKSQFESLQEAYNELNSKYSDCSTREKNLEIENNTLRAQLLASKQLCANLQSKVNTLDDLRKVLENKIESTKNSDIFENLESIKIKSIKSGSDASASDGKNRVSFHSNVIDDSGWRESKSLMTFEPFQTSKQNSSTVGESFDERKSFKKTSEARPDTAISTERRLTSQVRFQKPSAPSFPETNNVIDVGSKFIVHSSGVSSPLYSPSSVLRREAANSYDSNDSQPERTHPNIVLRDPVTDLSNQKPRDFTKELFQQLEKKLFLNTTLTKNVDNPNRLKADRNLNSSLSSIDNHTITEASYVGNVKIHEVNKNGYYIRLLNVSNTHEEDLSNFSIQQMVSTMPVAVFRFPYPTKLAPGNTITIWSRTDEVEQQPPHVFVWNEQKKWGTGPECTTILAKPNGQAVSWTTGCHKYGNIAFKDFDEIVPVYQHRRNKSNVFLERGNLTPRKFYTPTKHPHGIASMRTNSEINELSIGSNVNDTFSNSPIQRNLISRPRSSISNKSNMKLFYKRIKMKQNLLTKSFLSINHSKENILNQENALNDNANYFQKAENKY